MQNTHGSSTWYKTTQRCSAQDKCGAQHTSTDASSRTTQLSGDKPAIAYIDPSSPGDPASSMENTARGTGTRPRPLAFTAPPVHSRSEPAATVGLIGVRKQTMRLLYASILPVEQDPTVYRWVPDVIRDALCLVVSDDTPKEEFEKELKSLWRDMPAKMALAERRDALAAEHGVSTLTCDCGPR